MTSVVPGTSSGSVLSAGFLAGSLRRLLGSRNPPVADEIAHGEVLAEVEAPPSVNAPAPAPKSDAMTEGQGAISTAPASPLVSQKGGGRRVLGPQRRLPLLDATNRNFVLERLRHEVVKMLVVQELPEGGVTYLPDDVLQNFALSDEQGLAQLIADELASRLYPTESEKAYDTVLSSGEYGAIFGAGLAQALMRRNPGSGRVLQRFLAKASAEEESKPLFRVTRGTTEDRLVLSNRRVVLAVPVITPETWEDLSAQYAHLRGSAENTNAVAVVAILRIGKPPEALRAGLRIESFATYY
jgi:hypothetical protein